MSGESTNALLGTSPGVFVGVTVVVMGAAAYMTGRAVANTWRSPVQVALYCLALACGSRFLIFALFDGLLMSWTGFLADIVVLCAIGLSAWRLHHAAKMVHQYPWLYRRTGWWGYEEWHTGTG